MPKSLPEKVELCLCGLPRIEHNRLYSMEEQDRVMALCESLVKSKICTEKMALECNERVIKECTG